MNIMNIMNEYYKYYEYYKYSERTRWLFGGMAILDFWYI